MAKIEYIEESKSGIFECADDLYVGNSIEIPFCLLGCMVCMTGLFGLN